MNNENKVIVKLYVPTIGEEYDLWIPINKSVNNAVRLMIQAIGEFTNGEYEPKNIPILYDRTTAKVYDFNQTVQDSGIKNGTELILI